MANIQQKAVAAGFLHALQDPNVFAEYEAAKGDSAALRALIQKTLGLAQPPSEDDLAAMKEHADQALQAEHQRLMTAQPNAPHVVGHAFTAQSQDS